MLNGKKIVLGVTGGIAAYKCVDLASRLRKKGAEVHVILTRGAQNFVTETAMREISGNPVITSMWGEIHNYDVEHIALATLADVVLIAPATANVLAKAAAGIADDMLTTTVLATRAPIFFAPAMNSNMYENPVTQRNITTLQQRGWQLIPPASGHLACGTSGIGRMPEPSELVEVLENYFAGEGGSVESADGNTMDSTMGNTMQGLKLLVTAAGTREPIDPVRYIGNRSSGKMGYAIAEAAARLGAEVTLISGPSALQPPAGVEFFGVESAREMRQLVQERFPACDIVIKAAAVADYRVKNVSDQKIKKNDAELTLVLEKNPDILKELGEMKQPHQTLVGFAAETQNLLQYAKGKLEKKNLDMIVANDVSKPQAGFNVDTNLIKLLKRDGSIEELPLMSKKELAYIILDRVMKLRM
ncbi:bifunctional phosphopantothenoylcysteine decarboxylase/phosphopantothenate--cysteine ligase CoaBC [Veillonellaceae bacterium WCA-693-APC-5D-A]|uniref:Coenzyme A biosynthesis bifunctional protein CoaBC n=1 Tax=Anaerovibrio slackiae TaxID=2652309 RepID=A0A6I2UIM6_9FIRM|nr:bifunctional phosphopantothenoylcysteine decarboxylase/phosphopantothenate--cysteine ligase CoaBC [Anaerovibrio slackiae]MSU09021.1 bifunctional phosphopantothenoylcysteine decarboxylase/phosphopantothenate--cysteine ligase CoaBC [Anaerovibrio slackiae]